MPLPAIAAAGGFLASLIGAGSTAATVAGIAWTVWRIFTIVSLVKAGIWLAMAYFAKDIFAWWVDFCLTFVDAAFSLIGVEDLVGRVTDLLQLLPDKLLEFMAWVDVMGNLSFLLSCLFLNMALRSIPIVGGIFRG